MLVSILPIGQKILATWCRLAEDVGCQSPLLSEWITRQDRCWSVHKSLLQQTLIHNFKNFQKDSPQIAFLSKDSTTLAQQVRFGRELCEKAITNYLKWSKEIAKQLLNWKIERISIVDRSILVLALTEIMELKTPLSVSMNEYIEIAKVYSSPKSTSFVNGLLESILKHLQYPLLDKTTELTH